MIYRTGNSQDSHGDSTGNSTGDGTGHRSNEKKSPKIGMDFWHEKQSIFTNRTSYFWLFLAIFAYFCLFANLQQISTNLHKSTLLFAPKIHAYFCLFFVI